MRTQSAARLVSDVLASNYNLADIVNSQEFRKKGRSSLPNLLKKLPASYYEIVLLDAKGKETYRISSGNRTDYDYFSSAAVKTAAETGVSAGNVEYSRYMPPVFVSAVPLPDKSGFAAKEAIFKAINSQFKEPITWTDIEIISTESGKPEVLIKRNDELGIIADSMNFEFIKNKLQNKKEASKFELINLNKDNLENLKNIKYETVVFATDMKKMKKEKDIIYSIIKDAKYLIINSDLYTLIEEFKDSKPRVISYGMGQKSTVTASSIKEDEIMICLQRNMEDIKGNIIEMQEIKVNMEDITNDKVYDLLVVFILEKLYN